VSCLFLWTLACAGFFPPFELKERFASGQVPAPPQGRCALFFPNNRERDVPTTAPRKESLVDRLPVSRPLFLIQAVEVTHFLAAPVPTTSLTSCVAFCVLCSCFPTPRTSVFQLGVIWHCFFFVQPSCLPPSLQHKPRFFFC